MKSTTTVALTTQGRSALAKRPVWSASPGCALPIRDQSACTGFLRRRTETRSESWSVSSSCDSCSCGAPGGITIRGRVNQEGQDDPEPAPAGHTSGDRVDQDIGQGGNLIWFLSQIVHSL